MSLTMIPVAIPFALLLPLPPPAAWPFLLLSSVIQTGYSLFLIAAYRHGDLGQAPAPARLIEGGMPTEATVAQVLVSTLGSQSAQ